MQVGTYTIFQELYIIGFSATAITCPPLSNLTNGSLSYSNVPGQNNSYAFNVEATYSCDTGFSLVDNNTRTCTGDGSSTNGSFDGEAPTCEGDSMKNAELCSNILYIQSLPALPRVILSMALWFTTVI